MHRKLLLMAFEKVQIELNDEGDKSASINKRAIRLSDIVSQDFAYSPKSFRTLYKNAKKNEEGNFIIPRAEVVPVLVKYVGYKSYEEFVLVNKEEDEHKIDDVGAMKISLTDGSDIKQEISINKKNNLNKIFVFAVIALAIIISFYFYKNRQKWMVWNGDSYEIKSFDAGLEKNGVLNLYDENNYNYLKKITPTCDTQFFNGDGSESIWYGKNRKKEYEFFTALGKHPETGKTLKPITKYIIEKYICP